MTPSQNRNNTSNKDYIQSCVTPQKQNYIVQASSTPPCLTPINTTLLIAHVELQKTKQLPPAGKEYFCFHINGRYYHAAQCVKSRIMNRFIYYILYIDTFEKQSVVVKGVIQSTRLGYHIKTIGIYQALCTRFTFEHKFLNNIKRYINMQGSVTTNKTSRIS